MGTPGMDTLDDDILSQIETLIAKAQHRIDAFHDSVKSRGKASRSGRKTLKRVSNTIRDAFGETQREAQAMCEELTSLKSSLGTLVQLATQQVIQADYRRNVLTSMQPVNVQGSCKRPGYCRSAAK